MDQNRQAESCRQEWVTNHFELQVTHAAFNFQQKRVQNSESNVNSFNRSSHWRCSINRSSRSEMFFKIVVVKNLAKFTEKHLCWSLFLMTFQA